MDSPLFMSMVCIALIQILEYHTMNILLFIKTNSRPEECENFENSSIKTERMICKLYSGSVTS